MSSEDHQQVFKVDSYVWYDYSLTLGKYRRALFKGYKTHTDGSTLCELIDETNGSFRTVPASKVSKEKPLRKKRRSPRRNNSN
jgi:hypothetical protein